MGGVPRKKEKTMIVMEIVTIIVIRIAMQNEMKKEQASEQMIQKNSCQRGSIIQLAIKQQI